MRTLIVEDDPIMAKAVELSLAQEGFVCNIVTTGKVGIEKGRIYDYDMILLNLILPDTNGYNVLQSLRSAKLKTPIIIVSTLSSPEHKIKALNMGADDFIAKPFDSGELIARIQAIVRRSKGHSESVVRFDKVAINLDTRTVDVDVDGMQVHLTNKEFAILELLFRKKGQVVDHEIIFNHLYTNSSKPPPDTNVIKVYICLLQKKLSEASGGVKYIKTIWGRGYMIK